jgi:hypothetical protein
VARGAQVVGERQDAPGQAVHMVEEHYLGHGFTSPRDSE